VAATQRTAVPETEFRVVDATAVPHTAAPTLSFTLEATEPSGREVYTIALTAEIQIEPARRTYDDETRARLVDLFGAAERWGSTTQSVVWTQASVLVQSFTGSTTFELPVLSNYDLEVAATKYFYSLPGGEIPLVFHFTGTIFYRGDAGRMQIVKVPWSCSSDFALPVDTWRQMVALHYSSSGWIRLHDDTLERLRRRQAERGLPTFDAVVTELFEEAER
jgi:hypothetical protein